MADNFGLPNPIEVSTPVTAAAPTIKAVLAARRVDLPGSIVLPFASADPFLIVTAPPNSTVTFHTRRNASTVPQEMAIGFFGANRRTWSVFNDSEAATLYLKMGPTASLTSFTVKIPPQHLYEPPRHWITYGGALSGVWDVAEPGAASLCMEFA